MKWPRWWRAFGNPRTEETGEMAFARYMAERFGDESRALAEGLPPSPVPMNRAPELGPGLCRPKLDDVNRRTAADMREAIGAADDDELHRIAAESFRRVELPRTYPEPVLVIGPEAKPSDGFLQLLNDRGYNVIVAPVGSVKMLGEPWQVFTAADVALLREFTIAADADDEHLDAMRAAAGSLADRIEHALLEAPQ